MPKHDLPIIAVVETLENTGCFAEALFFPEILRFDFDEEKAVESLKANIRKIVEESPLVALHQRHPAGVPELDEVPVTIDPPAGQNLWRTPLALKFSIVRWNHGDVAQLAYVPALCIAVVATKPPTKEALDQLVRQHIRATLARRNALDSLGQLIWLQRERELRIVHNSVEVSLLTPKQLLAKDAKREEDKQSALAEAATDLTKEKLPVAYEMEEIVAQLAETLTGRAPRSALLIGRSGVGKTAVVYELARRRQDFQLAHTPFWATNGSRLVAGMSGFGQWQERCQRLWREAAQERAIIYLGNLIELMEVGKSISNSQGIADFLRPYIARGDVLSIAECAPEQLALVERLNPRLLDAFHQLKIEEPSIERGRGVLLNFALAQESENCVELEAIERIDQLHRRYATYSAYPGRPVRFLKNLLQDRPEGKTLNAEDVTAAFSRETGLPRVLLDEREELDLAAARAWFAQRVIGQPDAVDLIVDLLATVKAGLTRPRKPIASLLFIGPTGVGKTEMAKSLAEFLFQDRNRMARFDMSEYSDPFAVNRLIGGVYGQAEGLLTSKVREQPFAVVLLDEFEKAHQSFFDLLLQVLGEGRLTDSMGRVADFSNAVVIMTSNLGAESFQRGLVGFGQAAATRAAASKHFTNAVRAALRPEMFNRIDRIVPFAPLDEATVLEIAGREIERIKQRDGIRYRGVELKVWDGVTKHFAHRGYDPRYGARPLKRVIARELLAPLSEALNERTDDHPVRVNLWIEDEKLRLNVHQSSAKAGRSTIQIAEAPVAELARQCSSLRRQSQALERSATARNLENEIYNLQRIEKQLRRANWQNPVELARVAELSKLQKIARAIKGFAARIAQLEHETLLELYGNAELELDEVRPRLAAASKDWRELLIKVYAMRFKKPDTITLAIFGEDYKRLFEMARVYYLIAMRQILPDTKIGVWQFTAKTAAQTKKKKEAKTDEPPVERTQIEKPDQYLNAPREDIAGIAMTVNFPLAYLKLEAERGLHTFTEDRKSSRVLVDASNAAIEEYRVPANITRHDAIGHQEKRRSYNLDQSLIDDPVLDRKLAWSGTVTVELMNGLIEESLMAKVKKLIEE